MNTRIIPAYVEHERFFPTRHSFRYRVFVFVLDVSELDEIAAGSLLFGHNTTRSVSFFDDDYLAPGPGSVRDKLLQLFHEHGVQGLDAVQDIRLITTPRYFRYVFNPVSFYFLYGNEGRVIAAAEVNNTFGEKHVYVLDTPGSSLCDAAGFVNIPKSQDKRFPALFQNKKSFHVSPFFDMEGDYCFHMADVREHLDISIALLKEGKEAFRARLFQRGEAYAPDSKGLLKTLFLHPPAGLTFPRILREAATLRLKNKLMIHPKPDPVSPMTIRHKGIEKTKERCTPCDLSRRFIEAGLKKFQRGTLELRFPDGSRKTYGGQLPGPDARIHVRDEQLFKRLAREMDMGLGDTYVDGLWDSDDLLKVFTVILLNSHALNMPGPLAVASRLISGFRNKRNDIIGSRRNIHAHYDLGNDFFALFLDSGMTYSSAVYKDPESPVESLEAAQERKYEMMAAKARIRPGDHVLEVGCGWGGFAEYMARTRGCCVTGITVSDEQYAYAVRRMEKAGLADKVTIKKIDYRKLEGQFDAVVSIEMLEAVGHEYHATYFKTLEKLLAPGGRAVVQVITILDQRYEAYRKKGDWIRKRIFPGGLTPSLNRLSEVVKKYTPFVIEHVEDIGLHYAPTLAEWRERLKNKKAEALQLGLNERFLRSWEYYFSYCEAGFRMEHIGDVQLVLKRPRHLDEMRAPGSCRPAVS